MRRRLLLALLLCACTSAPAPDDAGDAAAELTFVRDQGTDAVVPDAPAPLDAPRCDVASCASNCRSVGYAGGLCAASGACVCYQGDPDAGADVLVVDALPEAAPVDAPTVPDAGPEAGDAALECGTGVGQPVCGSSDCYVAPGAVCDHSVTWEAICMGSNPDAGIPGTCVVWRCAYAPACPGCPDLRADPNNCGTCGHHCPSVPDGGRPYQCNAGMCVLL